MERCLCCGLSLEGLAPTYHAKCMSRMFGSSRVPAFDYTLDELNALAKATILARVSVPGVQPKLSLHLEKGGLEAGGRLTLVGLEGDYILKPQTPLWRCLPEAEHFCMLFARMCRIATADFALIPLKSGELAYLTRRMDRGAEGAVHMEDFCQITDKLTGQKYNGSMEQIGKALRRYSSVPGLDIVRFFERAVFCFLTGNSDMHLKNFSLMRKSNGYYEFSPAYDLVPVKLVMPADREEMALTLNGKKVKLTRKDFETFGHVIGLNQSQIHKAIGQSCDAASGQLDEALARSFLPVEMKDSFAASFKRLVGRLNSQNTACHPFTVGIHSPHEE